MTYGGRPFSGARLVRLTVISLRPGRALAGTGGVADRPVQEVVELAAGGVEDDRVGDRRRALRQRAADPRGDELGLQRRVAAGHAQVTGLDGGPETEDQRGGVAPAADQPRGRPLGDEPEQLLAVRAAVDAGVPVGGA